MLELLVIETIDTFLEANLPYVALGHIGLVLILVIVLFKLGKAEAEPESLEEDEENFSYSTDIPIMFRQSPMEPETDGVKEPLLPHEEAMMDSEEIPPPAEEDIQEETKPSEDSKETESETTEDETDLRRQEKLREILERETERAILAINRDEQILDLNNVAIELTHYTRDDLEGKKIDEIIFLEESESGNDPSAQQVAKIKHKDGALFPISVELEMADREFGIIVVTLFPSISDVETSAEEEPESPEESSTEPVAEEPPAEEEEKITLPDPEPEPEEETQPEPEEEPVSETEPEEEPEPIIAPALLPPPPPPPGGSRKPLAPLPRMPLPLTKPGSSAPSRMPGKIDDKTVDMFSPQLSQPLQSILQLAEMISADANASPHLKKYAIAIQAKSNRMMSQIEEMSVLSSVQKGLVEVKDKPFNLSRMITGLVDLATSVMIDQKQKIHCNCEEQDLIVESDEEHFEKILSNLINLALYAASDKEVSLSLQSDQIDDGSEAEKTISYEGRELQLGSNRRILVRAEFPSDANANRLFDMTINRGHDNAITHNVQNNSALKNHVSSLRLVKELSRLVGGKINFEAEGDEQGKIEIALELPCAQVGSYPA